MASQARKPQFGVSVVPLAESPEFALRDTRAAEEVRLDLVGIQDPPLPVAVPGRMDPYGDAAQPPAEIVQ